MGSTCIGHVTLLGTTNDHGAKLLIKSKSGYLPPYAVNSDVWGAATGGKHFGFTLGYTLKRQ